MTNIRLASGFWVAAKLREIQSAGGYASILVRGNEEAGAINLVLRSRDGTLRLAVLAMNLESGERKFTWRDGVFDDAQLQMHIEREQRFDRDQWFVECECSLQQFSEIFDVNSV